MPLVASLQWFLKILHRWFHWFYGAQYKKIGHYSLLSKSKVLAFQTWKARFIFYQPDLRLRPFSLAWLHWVLAVHFSKFSAECDYCSLIILLFVDCDTWLYSSALVWPNTGCPKMWAAALTTEGFVTKIAGCNICTTFLSFWWIWNIEILPDIVWWPICLFDTAIIGSGCFVQVGNCIELEAIGLQFKPYLWHPCGVTWDSSRTVVVIKLLWTPPWLQLPHCPSFQPSLVLKTYKFKKTISINKLLSSYVLLDKLAPSNLCICYSTNTEVQPLLCYWLN